MSAKNKAVETEPKKKEEDWMTKTWRPMMAMMYMAVCVADFIVFPIMFTIVQFWEVQAVNDAFRQWNPLTLQGAGLFHMAMGAVLGVTAWSRGQEKMASMASGSTTPAPSMGGSTPGMSASATSSWGSQPLGNTGSTVQSGSFNPPPNWGTTPVAPAPGVTTGWGGRAAPPQPEFYPER